MIIKINSRFIASNKCRKKNQSVSMMKSTDENKIGSTALKIKVFVVEQVFIFECALSI